MEHVSEDHGIVSLPSRHGVVETLDRLEDLLRARGVRIFARINQSAAAEAVGLTLRPMQLLIFGDPKTGTPLMDAYPSLAIDLPLKALVWEDAEGRVWLSYNSPSYLRRRHGLPVEPFIEVGKLMEKALE